jgi:hypothetical protein
MKKILTAALSFVAVFTLITGVTINNSAQASVLKATLVSSTWTQLGLTNDWISDELDAGPDGDHRFVNITVQAYNHHAFTFIPRILTGAVSFDDYADCNGDEVYSSLNACEYTINPGETIKFRVYLDNSSWWKDRDGVYLETFDFIDNYSLYYTFEGLNW